MADMILGPAQGAVDSLLGRLTSALADEARLLRGVRGDVQFIKDEMESMNGFLLRVVDDANGGDCEDEDHQLRAWMKQVAEVAYASQNCVDLYVRTVGTSAGEQGLLGFLRHLPQLLWTLPARHRIATQIRELKTRALEVGERRMRYGVEAPPRSKHIKASLLHTADDDDEDLKLKEDEDARRRALAEAQPVAFESLTLIKWMTDSDSGSASDPLHLPFDGSERTENVGEDSVPPPGDTGEEKQNSGGDAPPDQGHRSEKTEHSAERESLMNAQELLRQAWEALEFPSNPPTPRESVNSEFTDTSHSDDGDEIEELQSSDRKGRKKTDSKEEENYGAQPQAQVKSTPRVIALVTIGSSAEFAKKAFDDPWVASSCSLDCKAWIQLGPEYPRGPSTLLRDILEELAAPALGEGEWNYEPLLEKLKLQLKGKKFLIVLANVTDTSIWDAIKPAFLDDSCSPGSALLVTADSPEVAHAFSPDKVYEEFRIRIDSRKYLTNFYLKQAMALVSSNPKRKHLKPVMADIISRMVRETENCKLFLDVLYANPSQTIENFRTLLNSLYLSNSWSKNKKQLLLFAYNGLSANCKNCLLYLSIFPEHTTFRRTRLVRRWDAESMIPKRGRLSAQDEADQCLDVLLANRFVTPVDTNVPSMVKRFVMDHLTHRLVTKIASNENFCKTNLLPVWAHRIPIRNTTQQQQAAQQLQATCSKASWNIFSHFNRKYETVINEINGTELFLESLPLSTMFPPLEMLDLEDCKELQDRHLKNICNHVLQLKYLSLRNTDITKLPKQLNKLRYLETLDIRQTKVRAFSRNSLVLPKLKHLLAGLQTNHRSQQHTFLWNEPIFTVQMPKNIWALLELQVVSHVEVSNRGDELIGIGNLLQLRKLGLVLNKCQGPIFRHLYRAIEKLSKFLRSLSIRNMSDNKNANVDNGYITQHLYIIPMHLQKLKISGLEGLPRWILNLNELYKITLSETLLAAEDIEILGKLTRLCCLRLGEMSCSESTLTFSSYSFQSLKFLIIKCSDITNVNFADEAANNLKKIVWYSTGFQPLSLSGITGLENLKDLNLKGNFDLEEVNKEIAANQNKPRMETNSYDALDEDL